MMVIMVGLAGRHLSICVGECDLTNNYFHEKQINTFPEQIHGSAESA